MKSDGTLSELWVVVAFWSIRKGNDTRSKNPGTKIVSTSERVSIIYSTLVVERILLSSRSVFLSIFLLCSTARSPDHLFRESNEVGRADDAFYLIFRSGEKYARVSSLLLISLHL